MQSLPVLATMVVGIGIFVLAVHTIGQRPAAVRTFYQPGKYLCCAVLLPSAPVANLLLYLTEQKQKPLSIDDVTAMIAGQIGQLTPMDKETVEMFQQFAKKMIEQAGTK